MIAQEFDFDGPTYEAPLDRLRLNRQLRIVVEAMSDGQWRTLRQIAAVTGEPEASISARLRDLRKARFGQHAVDRRRRLTGGAGTFEYRVELLPSKVAASR